MTISEIIKQDRELTHRLLSCDDDDFEELAEIYESFTELYMDVFADLASNGDSYSRHIASALLGRGSGE